ncbi:PEP-CTERM sorting domain-containing protein [Pseudomonadota bacterium]
MINFRSAIFGAAMCVFGLGTVQATVVDTGNSLFDDETNLEWLDLTETDGMSYSNALASFSADGWVHATQTQFQTLFDHVITSYSDTSGNGSGFMTSATSTGFNLADTWIDMFGLTYNSSSSTASYGWYKDAAGILRLGGVFRGTSNAQFFRDYYYDYTSLFLSKGHAPVGVFMVRSVATVSEPATFAILGLGLASLGFARRRAKTGKSF